tara:strand:+ start:1388 stop:1741 length:354 start_codon:yes stop_codon:yes gene_type:complete
MANREQFEYKRRFDKIINLFKSICDLEIIVTPVDTKQEQLIINLSMTKDDFKTDYFDFIYSKKNLIESLTGYSFKDIDKISSCLLNYRDWMAETEFMSAESFGLIPMDGKIYLLPDD